MKIRWMKCAVVAGAIVSTLACQSGVDRAVSRVPEAGEVHLANLRQLTFGGQNAEAYFSADGQALIFQRQAPGSRCDQQFTMRIDGSGLRQISEGGRTTCGYFFTEDAEVLYSSTAHVDRVCPPPPDRSQGYTWALAPFDIYAQRRDGSGQRRLTDLPSYDAEATVSPDGETVVFTSTRDGDLDIYTMRPDGSHVTRLTTALGYDGGPFFSPDGSRIVYRAWHPTDSADVADYRSLLAANLVRPNRMEIFVMNADGTGQRQVTNLGGANFAPFFHPDGERIIFASNHEDPAGREFDLYLVSADGSGLERVTRSPEFDGFPMFSPDGTKLVFASNRYGTMEGETNIFLADWVESVP